MSGFTWNTTPVSSAFNPTKPSTPVSYPIDTLEELESGSYYESFHYPFNKSSVPLKPEPLPNRPRMLVCHDMQGGYKDDKWIQGGNNPNAYAIWHWYLIDVFVYFSHHLVTLPPPCWTNTAHQHGVKVLGTFILEHKEGDEMGKKLLSNPKVFAERLSELAANLCFDGWLLNLEINVEKEKIPELKEFVRHLTENMHSKVPGSLVIWYDAVTDDGRLAHQSKLNVRNKPYFDICDGIFTDYHWLPSYLKNQADVSDGRQYDVYMGVDVFERGTYYDGKWKIDTTLEKVKNAGISAAIFAPGWVYEVPQGDDFQTAQNKWWAKVEKSWGIVPDYSLSLPFYSNFDQGHGYHISVEGVLVSDNSWNNISSQGLQPYLEYTNQSSKDGLQAYIDFNEASYYGGGNITFRGVLDDNVSDVRMRLFQGKLPLRDSPVNLTFSVKKGENSMVGLKLDFSSNTNERTSVLLAPLAMTQSASEFSAVVLPRQVRKVERGSGWIICEFTVVGSTLTGINVVCYRPEAKTSEPSKDPSMSADQDNSTFHAVLGHITIKAFNDSSSFPSPDSWTVEDENRDQTGEKISLKIVWKLRDGKETLFPRYNIYVKKIGQGKLLEVEGQSDEYLYISDTEPEFLGVAHVQAFYVSGLYIPSGTESLKVIIQVCGADGTCQKLDESPSLEINVQRE